MRFSRAAIRPSRAVMRFSIDVKPRWLRTSAVIGKRTGSADDRREEIEIHNAAGISLLSVAFIVVARLVSLPLRHHCASEAVADDIDGGTPHVEDGIHPEQDRDALHG